MHQWFDILSLTNPEKGWEGQVDGLRESVLETVRIVRDEAAVLDAVDDERGYAKGETKTKTKRRGRIILGGISQGSATAVHVLLYLLSSFSFMASSSTRDQLLEVHPEALAKKKEEEERDQQAQSTSRPHPNQDAQNEKQAMTALQIVDIRNICAFVGISGWLPLRSQIQDLLPEDCQDCTSRDDLFDENGDDNPVAGDGGSCTHHTNNDDTSSDPSEGKIWRDLAQFYDSVIGLPIASLTSSSSSSPSPQVGIRGLDRAKHEPSLADAGETTEATEKAPAIPSPLPSPSPSPATTATTETQKQDISKSHLRKRGTNLAPALPTILLTHSADDPVIPIELGIQMSLVLSNLNALIEQRKPKGERVNRVTWKEYSDGGHWIQEPLGFERLVQFLQAMNLLVDV